MSTPAATRPPSDQPTGAAGANAALPSDLKLKTASAAKWSTIAFAGRMGTRFALTIPLAHLLGPHQFGIVGQASVLIGFATLFLDQGFGAALIQKRELTRLDRGSVFIMNLSAGTVLAAVFFFAAPLIAMFFHTPELDAVVRVLALDFILLALAVVPRSMLTRDLRMRTIALNEVGSGVVGASIGIAAAFAGAGYWALVIQTLAADALVAVVLLVVTGGPQTRGSWATIRALQGFSLRVMGFQVVNYGIRNLDNVLVGRYLGSAALGLYALSYRTMLLGVQGIGQVTNRVAFPVYSRLQEDRPSLRRYFLGTAGLLALGSSPIMVLVALAAPLGVPLVFGQAWHGAVVPMQILACLGLFQAVLTTVGTVFMACGRADWQLRWGLGSGVLIVASFVVGLQWGIIGVAACYAGVSVLLAPLSVYLVGRLLDFPLRTFAAALAPAAGASVFLALAWAGCDFALQALGAGAVLKLAVCPVAALGAFFLSLRLLWPSDLTNALQLGRLMVRGGPKS